MRRSSLATLLPGSNPAQLAREHRFVEGLGAIQVGDRDLEPVDGVVPGTFSLK
jgi:hypothetical protein